MNNSKSVSKIIGIQRKRNVVSGATCFFRNRVLFDVIREMIQRLDAEKCLILFHSCSVGAEVYSFIVSCLEDPDFTKKIEIHATDINPEYLEFAKHGKYDLLNINELTPSERKYFRPLGNNTAKADKILTENLTFLHPSDFRTFRTQQKYHVVFVLNSLCYVTPEEQALTLHQISRYNSHYLVLHGAHLKTIKKDLIRLKYKPIDSRGKQILESWNLKHLKGADILTKTLAFIQEKSARLAAYLEPLFFRKRCLYKTRSIFKKQSHYSGINPDTPQDVF